jgi:hypothetical protein
VNSNGFIEFGYDYLGRQPALWENLLDPNAVSVASQQGLAIIASLWVDQDQELGSSKVWYHLYDTNDIYNPSLATITQEVIDRANSDALKYGGFTTFSTTQVIVATWENQLPRVWYDPLHDKVRLQLLSN